MTSNFCRRVTGHSLGGALATLAALEARRACPDTTKLDISCYTFGAPRTGNHAFAREYNRAVPDTWASSTTRQASRPADEAALCQPYTQAYACRTCCIG